MKTLMNQYEHLACVLGAWFHQDVDVGILPRSRHPGSVSAHVPVRQWVLSLPIPLRVLLAGQPELATPMLQVVQGVITRHLLRADEGHGGAAVTLIQRFGSAANLMSTCTARCWTGCEGSHRRTGNPSAGGNARTSLL